MSFFAGGNIVFCKNLILFHKKMIETPFIFRFILTLPTLSLFKTMCLNILLLQCHSLPQNGNKLKKILKSFSCTEHKTVLILHNTDDEA